MAFPLKTLIPVASGVVGLVAGQMITHQMVPAVIAGGVMATVGYFSSKKVDTGSETDDTERLREMVETFELQTQELESYLSDRRISNDYLRRLDGVVGEKVQRIASLMHSIKFFYRNQADLSDIRQSQYFLTSCPQLAINTVKFYHQCINFPPSQATMETVELRTNNTLDTLIQAFEQQYDGYLKHEAVQISLDSAVLADMQALQKEVKI